MKANTEQMLEAIASLDPNHSLTLGDIDKDDTLDSELQYIVNQVAGPYCDDLYFIDDVISFRDNTRTMVYSVTYPYMTGYVDRDEQGPYADTRKETTSIEVLVSSEDTFAQIALRICKEVQGLENNYYSRKG